MLDILGAKRDGFSDEEIAKGIAKIYGQNYDQMVKEGFTPENIIKGAQSLEGSKLSTWEAFKAGADAEAWSELQGAKQLFGGELTEEQVAKENLAEQAFEASPFATTAGRFAGGILNPSTVAIPGSLFFKGTKGLVAAGMAAGGVSGFLRPIYDEEEELGRLAGAGVGAAAGGVLTGALAGLGKGIAKLAKGAEDPIVAPKVEADDISKTIPTASQKEEEVTNIEQQLGLTGENFVEKETIQALENELSYDNLPTLPNYLKGASPSWFGKASINFESDLDKALYIVGKGESKSKRHQDFVDYLTASLNLPENEVLALAKEARNEIASTIKKQDIFAASKQQPFTEANVKISSVLDNIINPVTKGLDESSLFVYNIGKKFTPIEGTGKYNLQLADIQSPTFKQFEKSMKELNPASETKDAIAAARGYYDLLNDMKLERGRAYKSQPFLELFNNKPYNLDLEINGTTKGKYDGCP